MIEKRNLAEAFGSFEETWSPRIAGDINDMQIKLAKFEGAFIWHHHDREDELFFVVTGRLRMELRDQDPVLVEAGEFVIVPRNVEHRPVAEVPCEVVLIEPRTTRNTGTVENSHTVRNPAYLADPMAKP